MIGFRPLGCAVLRSAPLQDATRCSRSAESECRIIITVAVYQMSIGESLDWSIARRRVLNVLGRFA